MAHSLVYVVEHGPILSLDLHAKTRSFGGPEESLAIYHAMVLMSYLPISHYVVHATQVILGVVEELD